MRQSESGTDAIFEFVRLIDSRAGEQEKRLVSEITLIRNEIDKANQNNKELDARLRDVETKLARIIFFGSVIGILITIFKDEIAMFAKILFTGTTGANLP